MTILSYLTGLFSRDEAVKMIIIGFIVIIIPVPGEWIVIVITAVNIRMSNSSGLKSQNRIRKRVNYPDQ